MAKLYAASLVLIALLAYAPTLDNDFLGDDYTIIAAFSGKGFGHLLGLFVADEIHGAWNERFLRPLRSWSLALDHALWGLDPLGFHLSDVALHIATSLAIFGLILHFGGERPAALVGASVFLVHPMNVDVVAWNTARDESLSAAPLLAALLLYLRGRGGLRWDPRLVGSWLLFAVSLFTKEYAVVFPVALVALAVTGEGRWTHHARGTLPYLGVIGVWAALRRIAFGGLVAGYGTGHVEPRADLLLVALGRFGRELVAPAAARPIVAAALAGCAVLVVAAGLGEVRRRLGALAYWAGIWPLLFVLPTHNLVFTARHLYLSFAGLAVALGLLLPYGARESRRVLVGVVAVLAVILLLPPTLEQEGAYARAALSCRVALEEIEAEAAVLPDGSVLVLAGLPRHQRPPWGFGWSLSDALGPPFLGERLEERLTLVVRRVWRPAALASLRARYPGRPVLALVWRPDWLRLEIVADRPVAADPRS